MSKDNMPTAKRSGKKGGKLFPALCNILGTLMLIAVIVTALPLALPRFLGYEVYEVVTGSMEPAIPVGSVIYVSPVESPKTIEAGEVIAFTDDGSVIVHRVVDNYYVQGEFVTKGDANPTQDFDKVPYSALVGRVERHFPMVGHLMSLYSSTVGKTYVLAFAACGLMFNILAGRIRDRRKARAQMELDEELRKYKISSQ